MLEKFLLNRGYCIFENKDAISFWALNSSLRLLEDENKESRERVREIKAAAVRKYGYDILNLVKLIGYNDRTAIADVCKKYVNNKKRFLDAVRYGSEIFGLEHGSGHEYVVRTMWTEVFLSVCKDTGKKKKSAAV